MLRTRFGIDIEIRLSKAYNEVTKRPGSISIEEFKANYIEKSFIGPAIQAGPSNQNIAQLTHMEFVNEIGRDVALLLISKKEDL